MKVLLLLIASLLWSAPEAAAYPSPTNARMTVRTLDRSCDDFAKRQIKLAEGLVGSKDFTGALRVLNVTAKNCDIKAVRSEIATVIDRWYTHILNQGSYGQIPSFLNVVTAQPYLLKQDRAKLEAKVVENTTRLISQMYDERNFAGAHRACTTYSGYTRRTFALNYYCGSAARKVLSYASAIAAYERMLNNWSDRQSFIRWDDAASQLQEMYLITTRFNDAFELAKRLVVRNPDRSYLMASLVSLRAMLLEPIVEHGDILFDGVAKDRAIGHFKTETERINFPSFVESIYMMTQEGGTDVEFYGADLINVPSSSLLRKGAGQHFLISSGDETAERYWLIARVDAGYFVVQFSGDVSIEEGILLDNLIGNVQEEEHWKALYNHEFDALYVALGSSLAAQIDGAFLAGVGLEAFGQVFDRNESLLYFCMQNEDGEIINAHQYQKSSLNYKENAWERSSTTPALYHHEVVFDGDTIQEVVWPIYDGEKWVGVTRIGLKSAY